MKVKYETFRGILSSWDALFQKAATFATTIGKGNVISISHSEDRMEGVVTVWYWSK